MAKCTTSVAWMCHHLSSVKYQNTVPHDSDKCMWLQEMDDIVLSTNKHKLLLCECCVQYMKHRMQSPTRTLISDITAANWHVSYMIPPTVFFPSIKQNSPWNSLPKVPLIVCLFFGWIECCDVTGITTLEWYTASVDKPCSLWYIRQQVHQQQLLWGMTCTGQGLDDLHQEKQSK